MTHRSTIWLAALATFASLAALPARSEEKPPISPEQLEFFEKKIRPVLVQHCYECHSAESKQVKSNYRLDSRLAMVVGGEIGAGLKPGDPENSPVIHAVRYSGDIKMPPGGKLPAEKIADLETWVKMGAPDPRDGAAAAKPKIDIAALRKHWSLQPPAIAPLPPVKDAAWPRSEIDRYILARLEFKGLAPAAEADRVTLLRRLSFDLIGVPPTFEEMQVAAGETSDLSYEATVDRLLADPRFGERWARYWLDVARFADTKGYVGVGVDRTYPDAFKYREFVIRAFNSDLPYDQFLKLQLAADQFPAGNTNPETLAAMGFMTLGRRFINNQTEIIDDRIDVLTRGTMGLTVTCARCHDHKYDPITAKDYYALYGVFASSAEPGGAPSPLRLVDSNPHNERVFIRGNPGNRGDEVPRRFLQVLAGDSPPLFKEGSGRKELAEAIASPTNPLTARVFANRVWDHLFGIGLVRTPSDFGTRADPPAHPDVLDFLAVKFVDDGWSLKQLVKRIVLSAAYRQSSTPRIKPPDFDPDNTLIWKKSRKRLDFEALRDSLLAASGALDPEIGGGSVKVAEAPFPRRRTLYAFIDRQNLPGLMRTFDFANPDTHAPRRFETTVPQQALYLMNGPFLFEQAERLAARAGEGSESERVRRMFQFALSRQPSDDELALALEFVARGSESLAPSSWVNGYGEYDASAQRIRNFQKLPHWTGAAWQGGPKLPDPTLGWSLLLPGGGHAGNDQAHATVRRWVAPAAGKITTKGKLKHSTDQGDGVRGRIVSSRSGLAGEWIAKTSSAEAAVSDFAVEAGDTIDFVVDCRGESSFDSFVWTIEIRLDPPAAGRAKWQSVSDFAGPGPAPPSPWTRFAQALLMSNEFTFVD